MASATKITGLEIAGFKSAVDAVKINVKNLTILAGQNSAGKSTIIQPMLLCKQTLEKPFDPGSLAIDGPIVQFTNANQFFSGQSDDNGAKDFSIRVESGSEFIKLIYTKTGDEDIRIKSMTFNDDDEVIEWFEKKELNSKSENLPSEIQRLFNMGLKVKENPFRDIILEIVRDRCVLVTRVMPKKGQRSLFNFNVSPASKMMSLIKNIIYLPGLIPLSGAADSFVFSATR